MNKYSNSINSIIFKYYIDRSRFSKFVPLYKVEDVLFMKGRPGPASSIQLNDRGLRNYVIYSAALRWTASPSTLNINGYHNVSYNVR